MKMCTFSRRWSSAWAAFVLWFWIVAIFREYVPTPPWMDLPLIITSALSLVGAFALAAIRIMAWVEAESKEATK